MCCYDSKSYRIWFINAIVYLSYSHLSNRMRMKNDLRYAKKLSRDVKYQLTYNLISSKKLVGRNTC